MTQNTLELYQNVVLPRHVSLFSAWFHKNNLFFSQNRSFSSSPSYANTIHNMLCIVSKCSEYCTACYSIFMPAMHLFSWNADNKNLLAKPPPKANKPGRGRSCCIKLGHLMANFTNWMYILIFLDYFICLFCSINGMLCFKFINLFL